MNGFGVVVALDRVYDESYFYIVARFTTTRDDGTVTNTDLDMTDCDSTNFPEDQLDDARRYEVTATFGFTQKLLCPEYPTDGPLVFKGTFLGTSYTKMSLITAYCNQTNDPT